MAGTYGAKLLDAALAENPAQDALAPTIVSLKNASQAIVTVVEQVAASRKSLYRAQAAAA